ncbi:MAG: TonB-dependent receptor plug domain-containing protein [Algoriphagus sp.]|nr:TonB-dependent receptor plug domain-containing protein [Algoriphagus sp.]
MRHLFLAIFLLATTQIFAQNELPDQIQTYLNKYQEDFPVEKAYLHLDKHTYTLGEDLWFSAYLVAGGTQVPSPMSKTLYVDLFDGDGLLLTQKMIQIENGRGKGDFKIPDFAKTGIYQIKAYTSWMKNFGEEYFFSQNLLVVDGLGGSFLPTMEVLDLKIIGEKVQYQIALQAVNSSGEPLANKKIEVFAIGNEETLFAQELQLSNNGEVEFVFTIPAKAYSSQRLELNFEENEGYIVSQKIRLPYSLQLADVQFLPEGGNWLIDKKAKLALRAVDPDGTPVSLTGSIEGHSETNFSTNFAGLGKVEFTPQKEDYSAWVKSGNYGEERKITLPKALNSGISIQVQNPEEGAFISAFVQGKDYEDNLLLISHTRGLINFMIKGTLTNGVWGARIPKKNLPSGINTIAILDQLGRPLLERLVFIQGEDLITLDLSSTSSIASRSKMEFELSSTYQNTPLPGSFSFSVLDADQVQDESNTNGSIFSHLLLSSDLKGRVYNPGYYFQHQNQETKEALDLVMLTHGWSRFTWADVLGEKYPDQGFYIEQGITIKGKVKEQIETKKGLGGGKINAVVGEGIELISSEYASDGIFLLTDLQYQDSVTVTLTAEDQRAKNYIDLEVEEPARLYSKVFAKYPDQITWPEGLMATVKERNLMQQLNSDLKIIDLEGVTISNKTLQEEQTANKKIYGSGDASLIPDEIPGGNGYVNIFQMLQGRVAGVRVNLNGFTASVQIRGVGSIQAGTEPLYLLDNIPVDAATLGQISPRDVQSIEVYKDPSRTAIFGSQGANGAIAVYTKSGAGISYQSVGGTLVTKYGGYATPREFYSPKYDEKSPATATTDKRATLYWNPMVTTDENGNANLTYFNSDTAKRHLIIIEGMDGQGRLGRMVKIIQ